MNYGALGNSYDLEDASAYHKPVGNGEINSKNGIYWRNGVAGVLITAVAITTVILNTNISTNIFKSSTPTSSEIEEVFSSSFIRTTVTNEYTKLGQKMFDYSFLKDAVLMEPWRDNYVSIEGLNANANETCTHSWSMTGKNGLSKEYFSGDISEESTFTAIPHSTGFYTMRIYADCGETKYRWKQEVVVKYVRRELSSLTDNDREEFLDAMKTLWDVDTVTGQKKYGEKYKSLYYFATIHNDGGANAICDEFHRNTGFINNHVYLGAFLEQSLQLVNPRTALHYWEYTKDFSSKDLDTHIVNQLDGGAWTDIMTEKFFGTSDPITGEILTGRWAHTQMPRLTTDFFEAHGINKDKTFFPTEEEEWVKYNEAHVTSPYGFMRGPWNFSPSPFTMRFNNAMRIPNAEKANSLTFKPFSGSTCSDYKQFITDYVVDKPLYSYLLYADAQIHGYVHYTTGGAGGDLAMAVDTKLRSEYGFTDDDIATISVATARFFKTWISMSTIPLPPGATNRLVCTDKQPWDKKNHVLTSNAQPGEPGGPSCKLNEDFVFRDEEAADTLMAMFFIDYQNDNDIPVREMIKGFTFKQKKDVMRLIFSRNQIDGDMAGSGSATDPLFWVAHGAVERLFQRTMFENVLKDKMYFTTGETGSQCQGHDPDKSLYWLTGFDFEDKAIKSHEITNRELNSILDPTGEKYATLVPFIYDSQSFDFCEGFDTWWKIYTPQELKAAAEKAAAELVANEAAKVAKEEAKAAKLAAQADKQTTTTDSASE